MVGVDIVSMAGYEVKMVFGVMHKQSMQFSRTSCDGVMGMAFQQV